jgi:uncharacterized membrane protein YvbJ
MECRNCGAENEDDAEFCSKCGEPLKEVSHDDRRRYRRSRGYYHRRAVCFGLPYGNLVGPLIAGAVLILIGLSLIYGFNFWQYIWNIILILVGILIILGVILNRRHPP